MKVYVVLYYEATNECMHGEARLEGVFSKPEDAVAKAQALMLRGKIRSPERIVERLRAGGDEEIDAGYFDTIVIETVEVQ